MSYTVKSVLIIVVVGMVSFFVAQLMFPDKHAVTQKDLQQPPPHKDKGGKPSGGKMARSSGTAPVAAPPSMPEQAPLTPSPAVLASAEQAPAVQVSAAKAAAPDTVTVIRPVRRGVRVERSAICTLIVEREPVGIMPGRFSSKNVRQLHYFTHVIGAYDTVTIQHRWYRNGKHVQTHIREIKSASWRTNTKRDFSASADDADKVGNWKIDVVETTNGTLLETIMFVVE
ncbi:MAG: DUF2914 domain-containing protein [Chitinispirillia bacterium]|nr:DUF2914 domain-containing protein [Chitinispirillia bacterium]MCL2268124.1 DUF2914 domain-containing protein [Chitinispirillia bacterium]